MLEWPTPQPDPTKANTRDADIRTTLLYEYSDRGQWARHYSTVRMTLGTFFITAATGIISLRWDKPDAATAIAALVVFLIGAGLFTLFSWLTFNEMNGQMRIVESYRTALTGTNTQVTEFGFMKLNGTGLPIAIVFTLAFLSFDWWWYHHPVPPAAVQITVPVKIQVGAQPPVSIDVPIKVPMP